MDFELVHNLALKKLKNFKNNPFQYFIKAIMGGVYLEIAMILSVSLGATLANINPTVSSIGFAGLFGIAFVMIVFLNGELFTGNVFVTSFALFHKTEKAQNVVSLLALNYLGNLIGASFIAYLYIKSGTQSDLVTPFITKVTLTKLHYGLNQVFIKSILCNLIVCVAAYVSIKVQDETARIIMMIIVVMAFVLPGFDHSIANIGLFAMNLFSLEVQSFSAMAANVGIATLGNILGGGLVYALPIYFITKD